MLHSDGSGIAPLQLSKSVLSSMEEYGSGYVTYPAMKHFSTRFDADDFLETVADRRNPGPRHGLSLYLRMPGCGAGFDCQACRGGSGRYRSRTDLYLGYLKREIDMQAALFSDMDAVEQLYVGAAASTCLCTGQSNDLMQHLRHSFNLAAGPGREYAIRIGACAASTAHVHALHVQGFNRLSLSAQDFSRHPADGIVHDGKRTQFSARAAELVEAAQAAGFRSVSVDFIYGHPCQDLMSVARNLSIIIAAGPDRVMLHGYMPPARTSRAGQPSCCAQLPGTESRLEMFHRCVRQLNAAGYAYIGMHHFTKPGDDLAVAQQQGRLYRNLQGFSIHPETDAIGCGVSAIAAVGNTYSQNTTQLNSYYAKIDAGMLPIGRGMHLTTDDLLRRFIIERLACNFELSLGVLEIAYPIVFKEYFAAELGMLRPMEADGLLRIAPDRITVHPRGRLLIHVICGVFDRHRTASPDQKIHPQRSLG
jgi:oxygen-independent coproporphyrinogen-3 oxidase